MGKIVNRRYYPLGIQLRDNLFCLTYMAKESLAGLPQVKLVQNPQLLLGPSQETLNPWAGGTPSISNPWERLSLDDLSDQ